MNVCDLCGFETAESSSAMKNHYFDHYKDSVKDYVKEFSNGDNTCAVCGKAFESEHNLTFHIGIDHDIINDIRYNNGEALVKFEEEAKNVTRRCSEVIDENKPFHSNKGNNAGYKDTLEEEDFQCVYCGKVFDNTVDLLLCYSDHFEPDLVRLCRKLLDSREEMSRSGQYSCPLCSLVETFPDIESLSCHIGGELVYVNGKGLT